MQLVDVDARWRATTVLVVTVQKTAEVPHVQFIDKFSPSLSITSYGGYGGDEGFFARLRAFFALRPIRTLSAR